MIIVIVGELIIFLFIIGWLNVVMVVSVVIKKLGKLVINFVSWLINLFLVVILVILKYKNSNIVLINVSIEGIC